MGKPIVSLPILYEDVWWYHAEYDYHGKVGGNSRCDGFIDSYGCCVTGGQLKNGIRDQCGPGAMWCRFDPWSSFKITNVDGPYESEAMCNAGNPDALQEDIFLKNNAFVIAETYGFFPSSGGKFEMEIPIYGNAWGFFATGDRNLKLHVRFNPITLSQVL